MSDPSSWNKPRAYPRLNVAGALLYSEGQARLLDMSLGGVGCVGQTERPLSIGDQLDFLISSENAEWFGPFSAQVVWAHERRIGLKFSPRCDRRAIEEALRTLQEERQERPEA
jgi:c-di-GMP-binding flagellar brake protein YcgR